MGESWDEVRERATGYFKALDKGTHLCFTHGGLITSYLYKQGISQMPANGSVFGVKIYEDGSAESLDFKWDFPYIEEDI